MIRRGFAVTSQIWTACSNANAQTEGSPRGENVRSYTRPFWGGSASLTISRRGTDSPSCCSAPRAGVRQANMRTLAATAARRTSRRHEFLITCCMRAANPGVNRYGCKQSVLIRALHRGFEVSPRSTSQIPLLRRGYSLFTHATSVRQLLALLSNGQLSPHDRS